MPNIAALSIALLAALLSLSCATTRSAPSQRTAVWWTAAPLLSGLQGNRNDTSAGDSHGGLVLLDSSSLRPVLWTRGGSGYVEMKVSDTSWAGIHLERVAVVTSWQGSRYHPESIRAISGDSLVMRSTVLRILDVASSAGSQLFLDLQGATPDDLPGLVDFTRAVREAARRIGRSPVGIIVPATDTIAYPTEILARVADVIVVRLQGEHREGTSPGPLASPEFITRTLGSRATGLGASRLVAELPLYGLRWNRDGSVTPTTFAEAHALVHREAGTFRRDPASQFLTASGRDGWTLWIPDARTIDAMMEAAQRRGVNRFALSGVEGADPALRARSWRPVRR